MNFGSPWSEKFIEQISEKEIRDAYVADQVRSRIALMIRALREQEDRNWSQAELGKRAGKPQNVVSRIEDPDYGQLSLQTLFKMAAAFDLPLLVDIPEWEDWFARTRHFNAQSFYRKSFNATYLVEQARQLSAPATSQSNVTSLPVRKDHMETQEKFFKELERKALEGKSYTNPDAPRVYRKTG